MLNSPAFTSAWKGQSIPATTNAALFVWCGCVSPYSARINTKVTNDSDYVKVVVSKYQDFSNPIYSEYKVLTSVLNDRHATFDILGLQPNTRYFYTVSNGTTRDPNTIQGSFKTFPNSAKSFKFVFAGDMASATASTLFLSIANWHYDAAFYLMVGDLHYTDTNVTSPATFRTNYNTVLQGTFRNLIKRMASNYNWDDHDFCGNNSDGTFVGRDTACNVYREYAPHYGLPDGAGAKSIYHTFTYSRVKFIVLDCRSNRNPVANTDSASKTMLGNAQKIWLKNELLKTKGVNPLTFIVTSVPWTSSSVVGDDWGRFQTERKEIIDYITANDVSGLVFLSADQHCVAADDGRNSRYGTGSLGGIPICHAAPLDQTTSQKGGPYSEGSSVANGQFGIVEIVDEGGDTIEWRFSGRGNTNAEVLKLQGNSANSPIPSSNAPAMFHIIRGKAKIESFRPSQITGQVCWFKAGTITSVAGKNIPLWLDSSGNGYNATTTSNFPVLIPDVLNHHPVARYSGNNIIKTGAFSSPITQPFSVFVVGSSGPTAGASTFFDGITSSFRNHLFVSSVNDLWQQSAAGQYVAQSNFQLNKAFLLNIEYNGVSSRYFRDGVLTGSGTVGAVALDGLTIGNNQPAAGGLIGDIAEIMVYSGILSSLNRILLENHLNSKYLLW